MRKCVTLPSFKAKDSIEREDVHRGPFISAPAPPIMETIAEKEASAENWEKGGAKVDTFDGFS